MFTSIENKVKEIERVNEIIESCETVADTRTAALAIDSLEANQPEEKKIIKEMRNVLCDLTFELYAKEYKKN